VRICKYHLFVHAPSKLNLSTSSHCTKHHHASVSIDPVNEQVLSENRKMITNQQLELYNEAAVDVLNSSKRNGRSRVKLLAASRQAALETIAQSNDGLHLPESTMNVVGVACVDLRLFVCYSVVLFNGIASAIVAAQSYCSSTAF